VRHVTAPDRPGEITKFLCWDGTDIMLASNMSGLTTMQSAIAEDLDAFAETSWFTSAYLVRTFPR
jgi:hypothetical protein